MGSYVWKQEGHRIMNRAVWLGLTSGLFFALSGVSYRGASLSIAEGDAFYRAIVAMGFVVIFQFVTMLIWLRLREAGQISLVLQAASYTHLTLPTQMLV